MDSILIIGSGGREYSIIKKLNNYAKIKLYGYGPNVNYGMKKLCLKFKQGSLEHFSEITSFIKENNINLVIIGPEKPLDNGIVDYILNNTYNNVRCVGPTRLNAQIESSKIFARYMLNKYNLNMYSPKHTIITSNKFYNHIESYYYNYMNLIHEHYGDDFVIKPDGLTSGKGVKIYKESFNNFKNASEYIKNEILNLQYSKSDNPICLKSQLNNKLLIEEQLIGEEFSLFTFTDGYNMHHSPIFQDFKRLNGNDGPMTGGMGCQSFGDSIPNFLSKNDLKLAESINEKIIKSFLKENYYMNNRIEPYKGILYGSFIKVKNKDNKNNINNPNGIYVIEFNCRFGDPECINLMELIDEEKTNLPKIFNLISYSYNDIIINYTKNINKLNYNFDFKTIIDKNSIFNLYPIYFKNNISLSKYLVTKGYPNKEVIIRNFTNNENLKYLELLDESYWIENDNIIYANVNLNEIKNYLEMGESRCFSICIINKNNENIYELEKKLNNIINFFNNDRFYFIEKMIK